MLCKGMKINFIESYKNLTLFERVFWFASIAGVLVLSIVARCDVLSIITSVIGVAALVFVAKGDVIGQLMLVVFAILYAIVSFKFSYYGEMITYAGMSLPMCIFSVVTWIKNPHKEREVKVNHLKATEIMLMFAVSIVVTVAFYFILKLLGTANLIPSTLSVITTFIAAYLTLRRSKFYAIGYACNDAVLIVLWILAAIKDNSYISMVFCFVIFLANDIYGFISWSRFSRKQIEK